MYRKATTITHAPRGPRVKAYSSSNEKAIGEKKAVRNTARLTRFGIHTRHVRFSCGQMTSSSPRTAVGRSTYPMTDMVVRSRRRSGSDAAMPSTASSITSKKQHIRVIQKYRSSAFLAFF